VTAVAPSARVACLDRREFDCHGLDRRLVGHDHHGVDDRGSRAPNVRAAARASVAALRQARRDALAVRWRGAFRRCEPKGLPAARGVAGAEEPRVRGSRRPDPNSPAAWGARGAEFSSLPEAVSAAARASVGIRPARSRRRAARRGPANDFSNRSCFVSGGLRKGRHEIEARSHLRATRRRGDANVLDYKTIRQTWEAR
jgi:hypothetical protein